MAGEAKALVKPFQEAVDFFRQKTNMPSSHWTAVMDEAHARSFAVAGATDKALIQDFRDAIDKGLSEGKGFNEFRGTFHDLVKKYGWKHTGDPGWRARIIYETNMSTAYAAGRYAQMTQPAVLAAFPYWQYHHVNCPHPRLQHLAWDGMVLRADDPFWATCYPPNGWGCHCYVSATNDRGLARMGKDGLDDSPKLQWREYINRTTGIVTKYPVGVDPGFVGNPGRAWLEKKPIPVTPSVRPIGAPPAVLALPGQTAVAPAVLERFMQAPQGAVQVGTMDAKLMQALGTKSPRVLLSADTMKKQLGKRPGNPGHPELNLAAYVALDKLIASPELVFEKGDQKIVVVREAAGIWFAVIKTTKDRKETYLVSYRLTSVKDVLSQLAHAKIIVGEKSDWTRR
jgi:hypothetical protein